MTGQKTFFCKSGWARKFWTALIGQIKKRQKWTSHSYFCPVLISAGPYTVRLRGKNTTRGNIYLLIPDWLISSRKMAGFLRNLMAGKFCQFLSLDLCVALTSDTLSDTKIWPKI